MNQAARKIKTTATVIIYSSHSEMIVPYLVGGIVRWRKYTGYCESGDGGRNRNYVFDQYSNQDTSLIKDVFDRINDTTSFKELVFEGVDELPISGQAEFQVGKGLWNLSW
jgi:hypothetical protein